MSGKKYIWLSDLHFSDMDSEEKTNLIDTLIDYKEVEGVLGLLITGNTARANVLHDAIKEINDLTGLPIYFVLGNQDFWGSNIKEVKVKTSDKFKDHSLGINYLSLNTRHFKLDDGIYVTGTDGFYDTMAGTLDPNMDISFDAWYIDDFKYSKNLGGLPELRKKVFETSTTDSFNLGTDLEEIVTYKPSKIIILTGAVPFKENCLDFSDDILADHLLPFLVNQNLGDMLTVYARNNPNIKFEVYSGAVIAPSKHQVLDNLVSFSGQSGISGELEV